MKKKLVCLMLVVFCYLITPAAFADESSDCDDIFTTEESAGGLYIGDTLVSRAFVMRFKIACEYTIDKVNEYNEFQESLGKYTDKAVGVVGKAAKGGVDSVAGFLKSAAGGAEILGKHLNIHGKMFPKGGENLTAEERTSLAYDLGKDAQTAADNNVKGLGGLSSFYQTRIPPRSK